MIRKATENDITGVVRIYDAIHTLEEQGKMTIGWRREAYPTEQTAIAALERGDLFVYDEGASSLPPSSIKSNLTVTVRDGGRQMPWTAK